MWLQFYKIRVSFGTSLQRLTFKDPQPRFLRHYSFLEVSIRIDGEWKFYLTIYNDVTWEMVGIVKFRSHIRWYRCLRKALTIYSLEFVHPLRGINSSNTSFFDLHCMSIQFKFHLIFNFNLHWHSSLWGPLSVFTTSFVT